MVYWIILLTLPEVAAVRRLGTLLDEWPQERHLFFADEEGGEPAADAFCYAEGPAALLVGPEGGVDDAIHILHRYRADHYQGSERALRISVRLVGTALLLTWYL